MKARLIPANLATHIHTPLRFGRYWRGHELLLRVIQLLVLLWLAVEGAKLVAHFVRMGVQQLAS